MNMPGFNAEASLYGTSEPYRAMSGAHYHGGRASRQEGTDLHLALNFTSFVDCQRFPELCNIVVSPTCESLAPWPGLTKCGTAYAVCHSGAGDPMGCCAWWSQNCQSSGGGGGNGGFGWGGHGHAHE